MRRYEGKVVLVRPVLPSRKGEARRASGLNWRQATRARSLALEHDGRFDLPLRDYLFLFAPPAPPRRGNQREAFALIEANGPHGVGPGAHQHAPCTQTAEM